MADCTEGAIRALKAVMLFCNMARMSTMVLSMHFSTVLSMQSSTSACTSPLCTRALDAPCGVPGVMKPCVSVSDIEASMVMTSEAAVASVG